MENIIHLETWCLLSKKPSEEGYENLMSVMPDFYNPKPLITVQQLHGEGRLVETELMDCCTLARWCRSKNCIGTFSCYQSLSGGGKPRYSVKSAKSFGNVCSFLVCAFNPFPLLQMVNHGNSAGQRDLVFVLFFFNCSIQLSRHPQLQCTDCKS